MDTTRRTRRTGFWGNAGFFLSMSHLALASLSRAVRGAAPGLSSSAWPRRGFLTRRPKAAPKGRNHFLDTGDFGRMVEKAGDSGGTVEKAVVVGGGGGWQRKPTRCCLNNGCLNNIVVRGWPIPSEAESEILEKGKWAAGRRDMFLIGPAYERSKPGAGRMAERLRPPF